MKGEIIGMYRLKTTAAFDSAHFLHGYNGKCANIHGHHWVIEVSIKENRLQTSGEKRGMLVDFGDLKEAVRTLAGRFDHTLLYEKETLRETTINALKSEGFSLTELDFRPTAENLAAFFYNELKNSLPVESVVVYETPDNCAVYEEV